MEDWDANVSPCNFATTHFPAERSSFIPLQLRDHSFDSLRSEFLSPFNFATHETEDPFATPHLHCQNLRVQTPAKFQRTPKGRGGGGKTGGGGAKLTRRPPTENCFRPPSPRYVPPPPHCHLSYEVPYKLPEFPSVDPLKNTFRRVSKNGFQWLS